MIVVAFVVAAMLWLWFNFSKVDFIGFGVCVCRLNTYICCKLFWVLLFYTTLWARFGAIIVAGCGCAATAWLWRWQLLLLLLLRFVQHTHSACPGESYANNSTIHTYILVGACPTDSLPLSLTSVLRCVALRRTLNVAKQEMWQLLVAFIYSLSSVRH